MELNLPSFLKIPCEIIMNPKLRPSDGHIYGVIYWFAMLDNKKCYLTNVQIAKLLRIKPNSITNALNRLEKYNCIKRIFKDKSRRIRDEIIPLINNDEKDVPSNEGTRPLKCDNLSPQMRVHVPSNDVLNKRIKEENKKENLNCAFPADDDEKEKTQKHKKNDNPGFEQFWQAYPRRVNKKKARDIWDRQQLDGILPQILAFLKVAAVSARWVEDPQFIPHPTTFLNGERWEDDPSAYPPAKIDGKSNVKLSTGNEDYKGFIKK